MASLLAYVSHARAQRCMRVAPLITAFASLLLVQPALAQLAGPTGSLERFAPAVPGDPMFGVASPNIGGHLVPRATVAFDFASRPLSIQEGATRSAIVGRQAFLHLGAAFALFNRVQVSADMPFALVQGGDSPTIAGSTFTSPSAAQAGDLRLGARLRIVGGDWDPLMVGVGVNAFMPTAPKGSYAGDGAVRGEPQILLGGHLPNFVWSLATSATLRASDHPHTFNLGAGAAFVLGEGFFQFGPELTMAVPFSTDSSLSTLATSVATATPTAAELLFGAKVRPLRPLVLGAGAGPGLTNGWGTPVFFAVGTIGYDPRPPRRADSDGDGIPDVEDACPRTRGVASANAAKNGCPADRDGDGIADADDACPDKKGAASETPSKNGCPADRDGDRIPDADDACPDKKGVASDAPGKNGCPADGDRDGDGIPDADDACPDKKGTASDVPGKNGCPADRDRDRDGDGIPDADDACPDVKGSADEDPKENGCPQVQLTASEIVIKHQVRFVFGKAEVTQTVDPISDGLLEEVRQKIVDHPEIEVIEVQGHADSVGAEDYNLLLSKRRAEAVKDWLVQRGIASEKLTTRGFGSAVPIATNSTQPGRQENRRVRFVIVKKHAGN